MSGVRLTWQGKRGDVRGLSLPLQVVEEIGVARLALWAFDLIARQLDPEVVGMIAPDMGGGVETERTSQ